MLPRPRFLASSTPVRSVDSHCRPNWVLYCTLIRSCPAHTQVMPFLRTRHHAIHGDECHHEKEKKKTYPRDSVWPCTVETSLYYTIWHTRRDWKEKSHSYPHVYCVENWLTPQDHSLRQEAPSFPSLPLRSRAGGPPFFAAARPADRVRWMV